MAYVLVLFIRVAWRSFRSGDWCRQNAVGLWLAPARATPPCSRWCTHSVESALPALPSLVPSPAYRWLFADSGLPRAPPSALTATSASLRHCKHSSPLDHTRPTPHANPTTTTIAQTTWRLLTRTRTMISSVRRTAGGTVCLRYESVLCRRAHPPTPSRSRSCVCPLPLLSCSDRRWQRRPRLRSSCRVLRQEGGHRRGGTTGRQSVEYDRGPKGGWDGEKPWLTPILLAVGLFPALSLSVQPA